MSYRLELTPRLGYLHAVVTGENTKRNVLAYLAELRKECAVRKCYYVLLEERLAGPRLKLREVLEIVFSVRIEDAARLPSIAFVDATARIVSMRVAEALATLRGMQVWMFRSVGEAEQWLQGV